MSVTKESIVENLKTLSNQEVAVVAKKARYGSLLSRLAMDELIRRNKILKAELVKEQE